MENVKPVPELAAASSCSVDDDPEDVSSGVNDESTSDDGRRSKRAKTHDAEKNGTVSLDPNTRLEDAAEPEETDDDDKSPPEPYHAETVDTTPKGTEIRGGTQVCKYFDGFGYFLGTVVGRFPNEDPVQVRIEYSDGDVEDFDLDNSVLDRIVLPIQLEKRHGKWNVPLPTPVVSREASLSLWTIAANHNVSEWNGQDVDPRLVEEQFQLKIKGISRADTKEMAEFFLFMYERQCIWARRNSGDAPPWTANPILADFAFCNNYRELDRGTALFRAHILNLFERNQSLTRRQWIEMVLWASYMYRRANLVESFSTSDGLPDIPDMNREALSGLWDKMKMCQQSKRAFFTHVHQTTNFKNYKKDTESVLRARRRTEDEEDRSLFRQVLDDLVDGAESQDGEACLVAITRMPGVGSFLGWQILCDLKESRAIDFDDDSFVELGPGAITGLSEIFQDTSEPLKLAKKLVEHQEYVFEKLNLEFPYLRRDRLLSLKEIEHALCEYARFKKYQRVVARTRGHPTVLLSSSSIRKFKSRRALDNDKPCQRCSVVSSRGTICVACRLFTCGECQEQEESQPVEKDNVWVCPRCQYFDQADRQMLSPRRAPHNGLHDIPQRQSQKTGRDNFESDLVYV